MSMYKYSYKTMLVNFAGYRVLNNVSDSSYKKIVNTVGELAPSKISQTCIQYTCTDESVADPG